MRPGRRVHDRMRRVDELELLLAPQRLLRPFMLAVADRDRLARERLSCVDGVEDELDVLPVAFVGVVPVVEDVVEPVLECDPTRNAGLGGDVRVDGRRLSFGEAVRPPLVVAARIEGVPWEVEVVLVEVAGHILRRRSDLDQVSGPPRAAERNGLLTEEQVDVDRLVRLAVPTVLSLGDEPHDRGVPLGKRGLVRGVGRRVRRRNEREHGDEGTQDRAARVCGHEPRFFQGRRPVTSPWALRLRVRRSSRPHRCRTVGVDGCVTRTHTQRMPLPALNMGSDVAEALEHINIPSYVLDDTGVIRWLNTAARRMVGEVSGRQFTSVVAPEETRRARELFARNLLGTAPVTDSAVVLIDDSGARVGVEVSSVPLRRGGRVVGVFGQVSDVLEEPQGHPELSLTPRQAEVLQLLERGRSTDQIADELHLSRETVRNHIRHLLRAVGASSRLEAVAVARGERLATS